MMGRIFSITILLSLNFLILQKTNAQNIMVKEHLEQLKKGVLLVKLYTRQPSIQALRESGQEERANNLSKEQSFKNLAIVNAFQNKYNYSPQLYFFYSEDSRDIMNANFEGKLMGYDLQVLTNADVGKNFYIAEFGSTEGVGINALLIMDKEGNQLERPFPYFTRTFEGLFFLERSYDQTVELWNEKLHKAYEYYH